MQNYDIDNIKITLIIKDNSSKCFNIYIYMESIKELNQKIKNEKLTCFIKNICKIEA